MLAAAAERALRGERVDPFRLLEEHPDLADSLREELPRLLAVLEELEPGAEAGPEPSDLPAGWHEVGRLGGGGQGRVLLVEEEGTGRRAAFKVLGDGGGLREVLAFDRLRRSGHAAIVDLSRRPGDHAVRALAPALGGSPDPYRAAARALAPLPGGGLLMEALRSRGDRLEIPLDADLRGVLFRARIVPRRVGWGGGVFVGLFRSPVDSTEQGPALYWNLGRSSGYPRALPVMLRLTPLRTRTWNLLRPGGHGYRFRVPYEVTVEYRAEPPSVRVTLVEAETGRVLARTLRTVEEPLPPGRYSFGFRSQEQATEDGTRTEVEILSLTLEDLSEGRARLDVLILLARAAAGRGDEAAALRRIEEMRASPSFVEEELRDHPELSRLLR